MTKRVRCPMCNGILRKVYSTFGHFNLIDECSKCRYHPTNEEMEELVEYVGLGSLDI